MYVTFCDSYKNSMCQCKPNDLYFPPLFYYFKDVTEVAYKTIYFLILFLKTEMKKPANKYIKKENKATQQKKKDNQNKAKCQITMQFLKLV